MKTYNTITWLKDRDNRDCHNRNYAYC